MYLDDPIAVVDYASLYPSSIIEKNFSHEKLQELFPTIGGVKRIEILNITKTGRVKNARLYGDYGDKKI